MANSTYENLVAVAASLFRKQGYSASSVSDILTAADAAKGSLYHHFPGGKHDLAIAAARWSSDQVLELIARSFAKARSECLGFSGAIQNLVDELADLFEADNAYAFSPISASLLNGEANEAFRTEARTIFEKWQASFITESQGFGLSEAEVLYLGRKYLLLIEGAWIVARALGDASPIREVAQYMNETDDLSTRVHKMESL